jgi:tRNA (adenine22-N1)-methyltransferase
MNLGKRLESVYALVPEGAVLVDVGSDHGYLPAKLVKDGKIERSAVTDINFDPLESAKKTAKRFEVFDKLSFFLADGLDGVDYDYDTVTICGMGGILIADIISRAERCRECTLILQPMRHQELLRKYLWDNGYDIEKEVFSFENGKPYVVLVARYTGETKTYSEEDTYIGFETETGEDRRKYNEKLIRSLKKKILGVSEEEKEILTAVIEKLNRI